jgi:hypothetical protein
VPAIDAPPPFCDLVWHAAGGGRFTAEPTALYAAAVAIAGHNMGAAGFDMGARQVSLDMAGCTDVAALARRLAIWTGAATRHRAFEEKREAAMRPLTGEAIAALQAGLSDVMATDAWAFGSRLDLADRFSRERGLTRRQRDWAADILASARAAIASADARLAPEAGAEALTRAPRAAVREDLLEACRALSALDADRCREANAMGWSAVSSAPGHRLAGMATLTPLQAAHAWALVHPHRRQLAPDLRERLFGTALVPC